ncbi:hypothetical protein CDD83_7427 [Cordyceps sp. RAO-2017]|nr:hypothetical protein CDD83_7427 [Cordyceps sp. RAO-2017]
MSSLPTVAIAGASGLLGANIARAILQPSLRSKFANVIVLARSSSKKTEEFVEAGAKLRQYSEGNVKEALEGVDVLINAVGSSGNNFKETLVRSLPGTSVRLYFPSEFGVNHYIHDFAHKEWDFKKKLFRLASEIIPDVRMCRVYAGLFLEESIGPWFGFDTKHGKYEAVGSPSQPSSYVSMGDVGRALAVLASMPPDEVPTEVHLNGDSKSFLEIAEAMKRHGAGQIDVTSVPLDEYKAQVLSKPSKTEEYLRLLMGEGKIDHSKNGLGNHSHLLLGAGKVDAFKTIEDLAKETHGKPWADYDD